MNVPTSLSVMAATGPSSWSASSISSSDIWSTPASACHTYTSKRTNQDLRCWYIHACSGSIPDITEDRPIGTFLVCFGMSHINQTIKTCVKHRSTHKHRDNISSLTHTSSAIFMGFFLNGQFRAGFVSKHWNTLICILRCRKRKTIMQYVYIPWTMTLFLYVLPSWVDSTQLRY